MSYKQIMKLFIVYLNENNYSFVILPFKRRDQDFNLRLKINKNILCSKGGGLLFNIDVIEISTVADKGSLCP